MNVRCDRVVTAGIPFLVLFTPLAFGSVHPWAFSFMEAAVFLLVMIWMGKLVFLARNQESRARVLASQAFRLPTSSFTLPLTLFVALILLQLLPLPPSLLRLLSPSTYELYTKSLPGWPDRPPYEDLSFEKRDSQRIHAGVLLPTVDEVKKGIPIPYTRTFSASPLTPYSSLLTPHAPWFPLSIAPSLTRTDLLKLIAYAAFFFLVLLYPIGPSSSQPQAEERFIRSVLLGVLLSGLLVASIGFVQRFSWNGKILWFFVPYDWGVTRMGSYPRASGPFVNPNHFANYLALIFPLAIVGALFRTFVMPKRIEDAFRILCGFSALVLFSGILLSLSRSAWIGVLLVVSVLFWIFSWMPEEEKPSVLQKRGGFVVRFSAVGLCLILVVSLFFVGPSGRRQVDIRLEETVLQDTGLWGRSVIWKDTLRMVKDFPIFGVGLGSWPDLFPRYKSPPWSSDFYREAHNDYLELLAEAGIVGFGLLAWFFYQAGSRILRGLRTLPARASPVFAALISALGMMAFHEFFDFNLQIPANAFLFTLFFALALRMVGSGVEDQESGVSGRDSRVGISSSFPRFPMRGLRSSVLVAAMGAVALLLILALRQEKIPYPYNLKEPTSLAEVREAILSHPARSSTHLSLFRLLENKAPLPWQLNELAISLWLDPRNYRARDLYAVALFKQGRKEEGLKEISRSVSDYPSLSGHIYLSGRLLPWLSAEEQGAVEEGFKEAMDHKYPGVINGLGDFYGRLGRFSDQGKLYEEAALKEHNPTEKADYLLKAGLAYTSAGKEKQAAALFRQAVLATPKDPRPYQYLAPAREYSVAKKVISEGIMNGADPFSLYLSLAEAAAKSGKPHEKEEALSSAKEVIPEMAKKGADRFSLFLSLASTAQRVGDREEEKSALLGALEMRPSSSEVTFRLGVLYLQENSFDRAALYFSKVVAFSPRSADAFYHLAVAEEGRYRFFAAGKAYARAVELAPHNTGFQQRYEAFKRKVAENREGNPAESNHAIR